MGDRIAVTGATGLVGRAVVADLITRHHEVVVLARDPGRARNAIPGAADYVAYQQEHEGDWARLLTSVDAVVNLAGAPLFRPFTGRRYFRKVTRQRVEGTRHLAAVLRSAARPPRLLINASSVGVYGFGPPSDEVVEEDTAPLQGRHAPGSLAWETEASQVAPSTRVVLLRMGYVLSADGGGLPYQLQQARNGKAAYFAPGTQWLPWIHLADVVNFVAHALAEEHWRGAYNLVAPQEVQSRQFSETLAGVVQADPPRPTPAVLARLFVGAGADIILGGRRVVPARLTQAGYKFIHPDLHGAVQACAQAG
ncbi:TIGR01777 family oxidoreductase [Nonomuraea sp. 3N208]|uniref:TIGR01777 family oxidoreductase n=1 Tax=Nonomuraea sp. 3N208 TaxID=3457421 RepID=UPI003FD3CC11